MKYVYWIFGGIAGLVSAGIEYAYFAQLNLDSFRLFWLAKIFVLAVCVAFGIVAYKKMAGGQISIARTLFTGTLISFIRALVLVSVFAFLNYPDGGFYQSALDLSYEQLELKVEAGELERKELPDTKKRLENQLSLSGYSVSTLFGSILTGLVMAVLMAAFVSTNKMYETG